MYRYTALILTLLLASAAPASADEVRLANGDRFTGRVESLDGGTLTFSTDHGELQIPWNSVTALAVEEPLLVTVGDAEPVSVTILLAADEGRATLQPGGEIALVDLAALARPAPALALDGGAGAGFVSSAGSTDVNNLRLDADLLARHEENRYTLSAALTRSEDRDVESARNWNAAVKYDRFVSGRLFINSNAIFTNDRFRDMRLRSALGAGLGYQILQNPIVTLTADAGLGWVDENRIAGPDNRYTAARESAAVTVAAIPDLVQLFHQHDGYYGVTGDDDLFVRTQNGIRLTLAAGFVTTLRYDLDYNGAPLPGQESTEKTFSLTLGYRF